MLVTEAEAADLWCPDALIGVYAGNGGASVNRHHDVENDNRCRGAQCMAWRWVHESAVYRPSFPSFSVVGVGDDAILVRGPDIDLPPLSSPTPRGYCGRAGAP